MERQHAAKKYNLEGVSLEDRLYWRRIYADDAQLFASERSLVNCGVTIPMHVWKLHAPSSTALSHTSLEGRSCDPLTRQLYVHHGL